VKKHKEEQEMTKAVDKVKTQVDTEHAVTQFMLPDSDSTAEVALAQALSFCAQKMGLAGSQAAVERLQQCDRQAYKYCHYSIAKKVAESVGALDRNIKTIYIVDYDATPEDICFCEGAPTTLIHLIVWAERKTNALESLVNALDRALIQRYIEVVGTCPSMAHVLDVQVVDDDDVKDRVGYGAMLSSLYNRPIQIWER
jgi:hypothetical protein